ncbi:MAG: transglycosylase SLT domain-containing protein [Bryobacteraceae bacterium]|nr:transglycosylase SLT domain-containing protein [Bryobacteraceae bacterium]
MKTGRFSRLTLLALAAWLATSACATRARRAFLLPPVPPPALDPFLAPDPPLIPVDPNSEWRPILADAQLEEASHTEQVTSIIRHAESRFVSGRERLESGDLHASRAEFDQAVDILLETPFDAWDRRRAERKCEELVELIASLEAETAADFPEDAPVENGEPQAVAFDAAEKFDGLFTLPPSELPLELNDSVRKWMRYFMTENGRKILVGGLRRQGRYRAMIQRILDEEGLPQELIYLAQAESLFKPRALSNKKAAGIWQFMDYRGREYGLRRTPDFDDRLDPERATRAAARHLRDLYGEYGNWYLVMVAYNAGPGRVARAKRRTGQADFWEFHKRKAVPPETRNYVPMILAITIMAKRPKDYGLEELVADPPLEYATIHVRAATHLGLVADVLGRPLDEIREMNPAVLRDVVPAGRYLHVPAGQGAFVMSALEMVPASRRDCWRVHRLGPGQTLSQIAALYGTSEESLLIANGDAGGLAQAGDLLIVPVSYPSMKSAAQPPPSRSSAARSRAKPRSTRTRGAAVKSAAASLRAGHSRLSALEP